MYDGYRVHGGEDSTRVWRTPFRERPARLDAIMRSGSPRRRRRVNSKNRSMCRAGTSARATHKAQRQPRNRLVYIAIPASMNPS